MSTLFFSLLPDSVCRKVDKDMILLLTNDDGIDSPGLTILREELDKRYRVYVSAPARDRSGISNAIAMQDPIKIRKLGERVYSCSGYPADCVLTACLGALPEIPDCVISGINLGPNLGTDIVYSGTAAAARQASIMGKPGIALSIASFTPPFHFKPVLDFLFRYLEKLTAAWKPGYFLNVNTPTLDKSPLPVKTASLATLRYTSKLVRFSVSAEESYFFLQVLPDRMEIVPGTDLAAIKAGNISATADRKKPEENNYPDPYAEFFSEDTNALSGNRGGN